MISGIADQRRPAKSLDPLTSVEKIAVMVDFADSAMEVVIDADSARCRSSVCAVG